MKANLFLIFIILSLTYAKKVDVLSRSYNMGSEITKGNSIVSIGDVNGDGIPDLLTGDPSYLYNRGRVAVIYGNGKCGLPSIDLDSITASEGFVIPGERTNDRFGFSIGSLGDINRDGIPDFIIGAPGYNDHDGAAYVIFGKGDSNWKIKTLWKMNITVGFKIYDDIEGKKTLLGYSVHGPGDVNGDGIPDIVIGAPADDDEPNSWTGTVYVIYGRNDQVIKPTSVSKITPEEGFHVVGATSNDRIGYSVSSLGDLNGDGRVDIVIGEVGTGKVFVVYAPKDNPRFIFIDPMASKDGFVLSHKPGFGHAVNGEGDIDGDGKRDLIIGHVEDKSAFVILGKSMTGKNIDCAKDSSRNEFFKIYTTSPSTKFGSALSLSADVNGDNLNDILIGDPSYSNSGAVFVIYGSKEPFKDIEVDSMSDSQGYKIYENSWSTTSFGSSISVIKDSKATAGDQIVIGDSQKDSVLYVMFDKPIGDECFSEYSIRAHPWRIGGPIALVIGSFGYYIYSLLNRGKKTAKEEDKRELKNVQDFEALDTSNDTPSTISTSHAGMPSKPDTV